ncbi:MAG TPA: ribonuclease P protein component [Dongiaceae bacterium]|nr:ribonuclease P protein component [Dongiaceae bacterium]
MIGRLKRRAEFLQVAAANRKWVAPGLILQVRRQPEPHPSTNEAASEPVAAEAIRAEKIRVGFTASRKVGNAVKRNRARRRLRAVAEQVLPHAAPGNDFVLVARAATVERDFDALRNDLVAGLKKLKLYRQGEAA